MNKQNTFVRLNLNANEFRIGTKINILGNCESLVSKFIIETLGKSGFENFFNYAGSTNIFIEIEGMNKEEIILKRFDTSRVSLEECIERLDKVIHEAIDTPSFWKKMFITFKK